MNDKVILVCLLLFGVLAYAERDKWMPEKPAQIVYVTPTPAPIVKTVPPPPAPRLAPEGTFYVLEYVSVRTPHGITGFVPGQSVHLVRVDKVAGTLLVTDGQNQVSVEPTQITNDLDVATLAKRQDLQSQQELQREIAVARNEDIRMRRDAEIASAAHLQGRPSGSSVGGSSTLGQASSAASTSDAARNEMMRHSYHVYGSPYYYLNQ